MLDFESECKKPAGRKRPAASKVWSVSNLDNAAFIPDRGRRTQEACKSVGNSAGQSLGIEIMHERNAHSFSLEGLLLMESDKVAFIAYPRTRGGRGEGEGPQRGSAQQQLQQLLALCLHRIPNRLHLPPHARGPAAALGPAHVLSPSMLLPRFGKKVTTSSPKYVRLDWAGIADDQ